MAEVVIPEIKHEYIRQVDTETTKNDWFDECIADNKEAAWAGIGTGELDSQYQPSPIKEPDYYMQYCSSDDYDYLKDYRLIWGYGIGIIEQDVICSLSTGEHLAEGKDACDTYATENATGENTDWKRGIWLKFSGNRNVSPTRIGNVVLPERVISLKDLCVVLSSKSCIVESFNTDNVINMYNMFGNKSSRIFKLDSDFVKFTSAKCIDYAFAYTTTYYPTDLNGKNLGGQYLFYYTNFIENPEDINIKLYKFTFCGSNIIHKANHIYTCDKDITSAFQNNRIEDFPKVDYSAANILTNTFHSISFARDNETNLDVSSCVNIENCDGFLFTAYDNVINLTSPNCKWKGTNVFFNNNLRGTINLVNAAHYYDFWDKRDFLNNTNFNYIGLFNRFTTINGTIYGTGIFGCNIPNGNIVVKTEDKPEDININDIVNYYVDYNCFPALIMLGYYDNLESDKKDISNFNLDDYYFVNSIINGIHHANSGVVYSDVAINVDKSNKDFCILYNNLINSHLNITYNKDSNFCIINGNVQNVNDKHPYIVRDTNYKNIKLMSSDEVIKDITFYANFGLGQYVYVNIDAKDININFDLTYKNKIAHWVQSLHFGELNTFDVSNLLPDFYNNAGFNFFITKLKKYINNTYFGNIESVKNNRNINNGGGIALYTDNDFEYESSYEYENKKIMPSLFVGNITSGYRNNFPTINREYDYHAIMGAFNIDFATWAKRINSTIRHRLCLNRFDGLKETVTDIPTDYIFDYELFGEISIDGDFSNYNLLGRCSGWTLYINGIDSNTESEQPLSINNIIISGTVNIIYLINVKSDNLVFNVSCNSLSIIDCLELTNISIDGYSKLKSITVRDNNINTMSISNTVLETANLSTCAKLTQEAINNIVEPTLYKSGATLTIHTIPFQYITEEQKQALVDAGVTFVEYIPTETTE